MQRRRCRALAADERSPAAPATRPAAIMPHPTTSPSPRDLMPEPSPRVKHKAMLSAVLASAMYIPKRVTEPASLRPRAVPTAVRRLPEMARRDACARAEADRRPKDSAPRADPSAAPPPPTARPSPTAQTHLEALEATSPTALDTRSLGRCLPSEGGIDLPSEGGMSRGFLGRFDLPIAPDPMKVPCVAEE